MVGSNPINRGDTVLPQGNHCGGLGTLDEVATQVFQHEIACPGQPRGRYVILSKLNWSPFILAEIEIYVVVSREKRTEAYQN